MTATTIPSIRPSAHTMEHYAILHSYYSKLRRCKYYYLTLSPGVVHAIKLTHPSKQRCDIFWDESEMQMLIKLNGTQRCITTASTAPRGNYPAIPRARIYISSHIYLCEIPPNVNERLPVDIIDDKLIVDMEPPLIAKWGTEPKSDRVNVSDNDDTNRSVVKANRIEPTLKEMFEEASRKEGMSLYVWSRESLLKYVEDMHPEIYHDRKYWVKKEIQKATKLTKSNKHHKKGILDDE